MMRGMMDTLLQYLNRIPIQSTQSRIVLAGLSSFTYGEPSLSCTFVEIAISHVRPKNLCENFC